MGLEMRVSNGRCPTFLLAGCILLYIILLCNWWSLSTQNYDLSNQVNILEKQMQICCGERDICTTDKNKLEIAIGELKIQRDHDKTDYEATLKKKENTLSMCQTELESLKIVDATKTQSLESLRTNLEERKEEIKRLNEQIKQLSSITTDNKDIAIKNENNKNDGLEYTTELTENKDGERDVEMGNNVK